MAALTMASFTMFAGTPSLECMPLSLSPSRLVLEEEEERGVAHIVEHLAFSATTKYTNHDIVKFLEGIRAEFGACQNAVTSADETVYELFVPVDKPELLSQAFLSWLNSVLRLGYPKTIWIKKELLWKSIEGIGMLVEECRMLIGFL